MCTLPSGAAVLALAVTVSALHQNSHDAVSELERTLRQHEHTIAVLSSRIASYGDSAAADERRLLGGAFTTAPTACPAACCDGTPSLSVSTERFELQEAIGEVNYATCKDHCKSLGWQMPCITDADDEQKLLNVTRAGGFGQADGVWLGYNDKATEDEWEWEHGCSSSYAHWGSGKPDNAGGLEDCATLRYNRWDDCA